MIKKFIKVFAALCIAVTVFFNLTGSPGGITGYNSGTGCQNCHTGAGGTTTLTTNIPSAGITPGTTYTCTLTVASSGRSLFGCNLAVVAGSVKKGTLAAIGSRCQVSTNEITHQLNGGSVANACDFTFNWTAPSTLSTGVTFRWSGLSANGNGRDTGDMTSVSSSNFSLAPNAAQEVAEEAFQIYPNPATESVTIKRGNSEKSEIVQVFNLEGQLVYHTTITTGSTSFTFETTSFSKGMYIVKYGEFSQKLEVK